MTRRNGIVAMESQSAECTAAISDIKASKPAGSCEAHASICRGLIALLRCKVAEIEYARDMEKNMKRTIAKVTGATCAICGAIYAIIDNMSRIADMFK